MTTNHADEETPLLSHESPNFRTPVPWRQLSILLFLQLAEPLSSQVIYPFAPQLIRELGVTHGDEAKVGFYVGLIESLFFVTQAFTVLHWSRMSDRIGRKPVILCGLLGLSASMYSFGLSRTFLGLILSRCLNGALNGNIGVMKSMMAEMTDSSNISQAYAWVPISWSTGCTLAPLIGGSLSHPAERFPRPFGRSKFLREYPYFLPCGISATFALLAWFVTYFFLKETLAVKTPLALPNWLRPRKERTTPDQDARIADDASASSDSSQRPSTTKQAGKSSTGPLPLRALLTKPVLTATASYAALALVDIAYRAIQPLFLSTPLELGGLGWPPARIGRLLATWGVLNGLFTACFFSRIHNRWGTKTIFIWGIASAIPVFALFPLINCAARRAGAGGGVLVNALTLLQVVVSMGLSLSYGSIFIFISSSAPSRQSLGAVNGLSQVIVSIMRAVGPAAANSLFSISITSTYFGGQLVYVILVASTGLALLVSTMLPRRTTMPS
ncbi:MFS general substrate transporter [Pleurotus eryngii]|uniref:MFS general substrate transporter n=1 Tax=Pleurotus eryngii TaxID=5323 RepID=A0A9P6DFQ3_PLEER|nr:MFS general substrate transporter [Pleurotus eryngii]